MKHRHEVHKRAEGGAVHKFSGADSPVMKDAFERKRGGKVKEHMHGEGEKAKERHDRPARAHGGKVEKHEEHKGAMKHMHKRGRAQGGSIGANKHPLSTAATIKEVTKGESKQDMGRD
jgi:hypothetical protein